MRRKAYIPLCIGRLDGAYLTFEDDGLMVAVGDDAVIGGGALGTKLVRGTLAGVEYCEGGELLIYIAEIGGKRYKVPRREPSSRSLEL